LGSLAPDLAQSALVELAADPDVRVQGPALRALSRVNAPGLDRRLFDALAAPDFALRATAASIIGERRTPEGVAGLVAAYERGKSDATPAARLAVVDALGAIGGPAALATLTHALQDRDWPVRLRAASRLRAAGEAAARPLRPAGLRHDPAFFETDRLLRPAFSPQAYVDTRLGTLQIELNVVDAPLTTQAFIELARAGFFDGLRVHRLIPNFVIQTGDPRGDGQGGPGYWIMDELSPLPFVRGTVGMALAGPDTGGSQFFVALSPQPHLDARYTVFGRVVQGLDVLDLVMPGDVIERVRIWDGTTR
jgi:cyclophilin family peptidyl-prolyl cis-trans isomerase